MPYKKSAEEFAKKLEYDGKTFRGFEECNKDQFQEVWSPHKGCRLYTAIWSNSSKEYRIYKRRNIPKASLPKK